MLWNTNESLWLFDLISKLFEDYLDNLCCPLIVKALASKTEEVLAPTPKQWSSQHRHFQEICFRHVSYPSLRSQRSHRPESENLDKWNHTIRPTSRSDYKDFKDETYRIRAKERFVTTLEAQGLSHLQERHQNEPEVAVILTRVVKSPPVAGNPQQMPK